ncbi:MAG: hypothetical protein R3290_09295 [Acidimicrobiia bacterium]|nr:hypothetical protein [Acidimicrobiia bacterium]
MIRRLRGLLIILRTLLPVLVAVALALVTWLTARAVVDATAAYGDRLNTQLDGVRSALDEANDGIEAIGVFVTRTVDAADRVLVAVAAIPEDVDLALPEVEVPEFDLPFTDIPVRLPAFTLGDGDLSIPIPGVGPLKDMAGDLVAAGEDLAEPLTKVTALADVPPHLEQAARDTAAYAGDVRDSMGAWVFWVILLVVVAALAWVSARLRPMLDELGRGWSMLRGRPAPDRAVVDLDARIRALEARQDARV